MEILNYTPGQKATLFLETVNADGYRTNASEIPFVSRVILPDLTLSLGFPLEMDQLDVGLYTFQFTLPTGASAVGSYLLDVVYINPSSNNEIIKGYQIICSAPYGNFGVSIK
jgi:hypothetical protein